MGGVSEQWRGGGSSLPDPYTYNPGQLMSSSIEKLRFSDYTVSLREKEGNNSPAHDEAVLVLRNAVRFLIIHPTKLFHIKTSGGEV